MMIRLLQGELNKCYRREGVNHLENCGVYRGTSLFCARDGFDMRNKRVNSAAWPSRAIHAASPNEKGQGMLGFAEELL
jgi:hypothetical protein